jgi:hypothetical protein
MVLAVVQQGNRRVPLLVSIERHTRHRPAAIDFAKMDTVEGLAIALLL